MARRRNLKPEEQELWSQVKKTVAPLAPSRLLPTRSDGDTQKMDLAGNTELVAKPTSPLPVRKKPVAPFLPAFRPTVSQPKRHAGQPALEKPVHRKIAKGSIDIDARIDLHNMSQAVAHHRLANFLADARQHQMRHVLVITGKGQSSGGDGILKRMVPVWLTTEPMKADVSGFSASARHHGGEGALYVRLKKPR